MVNESYVRGKLAALRQYLDELRQVAASDLAEYRRDLFVRRTGERTVELVVECAVDINGHLCLELTGASPPDYYGSFLCIADEGVIPMDLASHLAPTAGLRNRLAHEYEAIVDQAVYRSIQRMLPNYTQYIVEVENWLSRSAPGPPPTP